MKNLSAVLVALAFTMPAHAEWMVDSGVAIVSPANNNSTMELLAVSCGDPFTIEVFSRGGPVRPDSGADAAANYFHTPGKVVARIDGREYRLTAAGTPAAVELFAQGPAARKHAAPIRVDFIDALKTGTTLTLAFDVTPEPNAADGTPHETVAEFPLSGSAAALDAALATCG